MSAKLWLPKHSEMHEKDFKKNIDEILFGKVYYKLLQGVITNGDSSLYYKLRQGVITNCNKFYYNCDKRLLQIATSFITNCDRYYKLQQVLLQIATGITNCNKFYYKLRQVLQIATSFITIATGITNCNKFYYNCDRYYKLQQVLLQLRQVLQIAKKNFYYKLRKVLQIATNCDRYYKLQQVLLQLRQVLQIATSFITTATGITNCNKFYYKLRQYRDAHKQTSTLSK